MSEATPINFDPLSFMGLYLKLLVNDIQLSMATGFVVQHKGQTFWARTGTCFPVAIRRLSSRYLRPPLSLIRFGSLTTPASLARQ